MAGEPQITTLPGGLRVVFTPVPNAQAAAVSYWTQVGSRDETPISNGLSHYIEHMLFKGTTRRPTAPEISEAIEGAGGSLNAFTTKEVTCYWNNLPFESAETGIEVLADMIQRSILDPAEIERERTVVQQEIRRAHDSPGSYVSELASVATYGDQPIGWPIAGTLETVNAMQRDDFIAHMRRFYTGENSVLSIAGNLDPDRILEVVAREFNELPSGLRPIRSVAVAQRPEDYIHIEERGIEQTNLTLSTLGFGRRDPDRYAADLMNTALGRGMSSRLFKEVRERRGLAYSVGSGAARYGDIGNVAVSAGVTREHQEEALQVIIAELQQLVDIPMSAEELQRTKDYACGAFRLSLETPMSFAQRHGGQLLNEGEIEPADVTVARLRAVTIEDIQRVARRLFYDARFSLAVVGPSASADRLDAILHGA
ncbi:MAG: pitrilysin family protein [Chloroflexi bacterium]|nr:pitrilysin family protein [Chloroflexota bacterium]MDA1239519.1 pitrilysin family protein [Chloroflexota bacterium]MQC25729.1 insulinase family protein [Chloroflexota bacterium]MQC47602.1 insulinase family protein [Chloroflexota bacterium]